MLQKTENPVIRVAIKWNSLYWYFNLIQSGFVVCAFYWQFSIGNLRISEKHGTLEGFGKRGQLMTEGFEKKTLREKKKMLLSSNFPFFLNVFHPIMTENSLCLSLNSSANASNLDLPTILSFGRVEKLLEKKTLLVMCNFALSHNFIRRAM